MAGVSVSFKFDPAQVLAVLRQGRAAVRQPYPPGPFRDGLKNAAETYRKFLRERYIRNARGGGEWRKLAPSTVKGDKPPRKGIMRKTDSLLNSIRILKTLPTGFQVGSRDQRALFHAKRTTNRPARLVVIPPDAETTRKMKADIAKGLGLATRQWSKVRIMRAASAAAPHVPVGLN